MSSRSSTSSASYPRTLSIDLHEFLLHGIERLGSSVVEASNHAVRLRRPVAAVPMIEAEDRFFSPEAGLAIGLSRILGVYCMEKEGTHMIEFDTVGGPALVRLIEREGPGETESSSYVAVAEEVFFGPINTDSLNALRSAIGDPVRLCPQCQREANHRIARAQALPIVTILQELTALDEAVHVIKPGCDAELSAALQFHSMELSGGLVSLIGTEGARLDIQLQFAHSVLVNHGRRGGESVSLLDLFDQRNQSVLRIAAAVPGMAERWNEICESEVR